MDDRRRRTVRDAADEVIAADAGRNAILSVLDEIGLPWRMTRAALVRRCGIRPHGAYGWDGIPVETERPLVRGLLGPLFAQHLPSASPVLPATYYSGSIWHRSDADQNLAEARHDVSKRLGRRPIETLNTVLRCRWDAGAASLSLTIWPDELRPSQACNPAHDRDPRLRTACLIEIETGYRPPLSAQERAWLDGFRPLGRIGAPASADDLRRSSAAEADLEFVREPPSDLDAVLGRIGGSGDGAALIFCGHQLTVVPAPRIVAFRVHRIQPARGPGGSRLEVECLAGEPTRLKRLTIARGSRPGDLDRLGADLAAAWSKPCESEASDDD